MKRTSRPRPAFTLVELLVVIIVIGILAAILLPALSGAMKNARRATIVMEMSQLESAVEAYKTQNAGEYPPDFTDSNNGTNHVGNHLRRVFARSTDNVTTTNWITGTGGLRRTDSQKPVTPQVLANLDPAEALVFWLAEVYNNPLRPLTGGGEYKNYFTFDQGRFKDNDNDGWWEYYPKNGSESPYVYFHNQTYSDSRARYPRVTHTPVNPSTNGVKGVARPYAAQPGSTIANSVWMNKDKFQIISGGLDGDYGADVYNSTPGRLKVFPNKLVPGGSNNQATENRDNLTNFGNGKTLEDNLP